MKKWLLCFAFLVRVHIPLGADLTFKHVKTVFLGAGGSTWTLILEDGREAFVPFMWTVIVEEEK